jgi:hypothetical protein
LASFIRSIRGRVDCRASVCRLGGAHCAHEKRRGEAQPVGTTETLELRYGAGVHLRDVVEDKWPIVFDPTIDGKRTIRGASAVRSVSGYTSVASDQL